MINQVLLQIVKNGFVFHHIEECSCGALVSSTTCTSSPVDVVDDVRRRMVVNDVLDVVDVDSSCGDVCADKDVSMTVPQCVEPFLSLLLVLASMQRCDALSKPCQMIMQSLYIVLHVHEDDDW